jgi:hypothetical protein
VPWDARVWQLEQTWLEVEAARAAWASPVPDGPAGRLGLHEHGKRSTGIEDVVITTSTEHHLQEAGVPRDPRQLLSSLT